MAFYTPRGAGARNSFRKLSKPGLVGSSRPGKGGLGTNNNAKLVGSSRPGKGGLGTNNNAKPGFKKPPKGTPRPAAPAAPVGQHAQPDAAYNQRVDVIDRGTEQRLGDLDAKETAIKHDFGIDDPTNPFSRAEGLKQLYLNKERAASAGLAAQGHLYSGSHERALARTRQEREAARAELRSAYESAISSIGSAKAGVKFDSEEERAQAFEDWLARAPEAEVALSDEDDQQAETLANASEDGTIKVEPPKVVASGPQQPTTSSPGERARQAAMAERKAVLIRARAAEKAAKKGKKGPGAPPKAGIPMAPNVNGSKPKVKPKAKTKVKKGRR